jgi:imidazolonepropionase-like amidohydrolase
MRVRRLAILLTALAFASPAPPSLAESLALVGGRVYTRPWDAPIEDGTVLVRDGQIVEVGERSAVALPADAEVVDCSDATVVAGFWNSHVHFMERKWADPRSIPAAELESQLDAMLTRWGFTSVFDTGSSLENTLELRRRIEQDGVPGPRIRTAGEVLVPVGGAPPALVLDVKGSMRIETPELADAAAAQAAARRLLDSGADGVKLYAATWAPPLVVMPEEVLRAAVDEAHRRGRPALAHPSNREGLLAAVRAGVDVLVHTTPQMGTWDDTTIATMKGAGVAVVPTLQLWGYELRHDRDSARERFVAAGVAQLSAWLAAGGVVLFGTDVGYMADYDPGQEYALMAKAGMDFRRILESLTTAPAERFGDATRLGAVAPGFVADLVVLNGQAADDVRVFTAIRSVIKEGRFIYREEAGLAPPEASR